MQVFYYNVTLTKFVLKFVLKANENTGRDPSYSENGFRLILPTVKMVLTDTPLVQ